MIGDQNTNQIQRNSNIQKLSNQIHQILHFISRLRKCFWKNIFLLYYPLGFYFNILIILLANQFLYKGWSQLQMHNKKETKGKKGSKKQGNINVFRKNVPNQILAYKTSSKNYLIQVNPQNAKKDIQKSKQITKKVPKSKKNKFLTEQTEKSTERELKMEPLIYKKSNLIKFSTVNNLEDLNIYQRCKSARKDKKPSQRNPISKKTGQNNRVSLKNVKIQSREQKTHSKSNKKLKLKALGFKNITKSKSVPQFLCITDRKDKQGRLLSPQVVDQQNSIYFSNYQESFKEQQKGKLLENKKSIIQKNPQNQKKQNMFIYESKQSAFGNRKAKMLNLGSTRDLLN